MREIVLDEGLVKRIELLNGVLLAVLALGAWALFSGSAAIGVLLGGALSITAFRLLKWQLYKAFRNPEALPSKAGLFASYYLRFLGEVFLVYVVMYYGWANPIAFLVGLSVVVLSISFVGGQLILLMLLEKGES